MRTDGFQGSFASDNYAAVLPEVMAAIAAVNDGDVVAYGADEHTARFERRIRETFGDAARGHLVFNGTAANVVGLRTVLRPWQAVICADSAHINTDEGGAPEGIGGIKLLTVPAPDGKITGPAIEHHLGRLGDVHGVQPHVISITQTTELGTRYEVGELRALADFAHARGLLLHVDGSRLFNAAASLGLPPREFTTDVGVDVLSLGGTKIGLLGAEAVVFLTPGLGDDFPYMRKGAMQLASKMRFPAAQFDALLADPELWGRAAGHANAMARRLAEGVDGTPGLAVVQRVQANGVFASLPADAREELQRRWRFYTWDERTGTVRWMCSWGTSEEQVDRFVADVRETCERSASQHNSLSDGSDLPARS